MEHSTGAHDDNLFSAALAWRTLHDLENAAQRIQQRWPLEKKVKAVLDNWCGRGVLVPGY
jgi:hypothetical protein